MSQKKYRRRKKKKIFRWVFAFLFISILGNYTWNFLRRFELLTLNPDNITIYGNTMISDNKILGLLNLKPQNLLTLDRGHIEKKLKLLPRIKNVSVKKDFPNSLKIQIEEVEIAGYLIKENTRYVVTGEGDIFRGLEGPAIKFKVFEKVNLKALSDLLTDIKKVNEDFYNKILALDKNYKNEVIIHTGKGYFKWGVLQEIDASVIALNIYLADKIIEIYKKEDRKFSYIDLRFVVIKDNRIEGSVIVK